MTYRILITGTRETLTLAMQRQVFASIVAVAEQLDVETEVTVVHGACPTGVDAFVDEYVMGDVMADVERHPADWAAHGRAAGPIRNKRMVDLGADICLAFPRGASRGTRGCIALAKAAGIPTVVTEL